MNWYSEDDKLLRRYLLNDVTAEERRLIEDKLLSGDESTASVDSDEPDFVDRLLLAEDELIDDYACGFLSEREQGLFEQSFVRTPTRREKLALAHEAVTYVAADKTIGLIENSEEILRVPRAVEPLQREQRGLEWKRVLFVPGWKIAVYASLALVAGFWVWHAVGSQSKLERGEEALQRAYKGQRSLEARVTGLPFQPFTITRGTQQELFDYRELDEADVLFRQAVRADQSSQSLHALGRLYLVKKEFDKAIDQFKLALESDQNNARLHSDLGAALLEKAKANSPRADERERALALGESLEELNKALELDDSLLEAYFNRALVRQVMGLKEQAEEGWSDYLKKDSGSPWAEEAKENLRLLQQKKQERAQWDQKIWTDFLVAYNKRDKAQGWQAFKVARLRTGNLISERLIKTWFESLQSGRMKDAQEQMQLLMWAGELELHNAGDRFTANLAAYYRQMNVPQRTAVIQARLWLSQAAKAYSDSLWGDAARLFVKSQELFQAAGDLCEAHFAESWVGYCLTRQAKSQKAIALFNTLIDTCQRRNYKSLLAYALQSQADALTGQNELSKALDVTRQSLQIAEQIEDPLCMLRNQGLIASVSLVFGKHEESLAASLKAVSLTTQAAADSKQVWGVYSTLPNSLLALGYTMAALDAQMEAHQLAITAGWPAYKSLSFTRLGSITSQLGRHAEAIGYAEQSLAEGQRLPDESAKTFLLADSLLFQGNVLRQAGNLHSALASYRQAVEMYARTPLSYYAYKAHEGSFLACLALQDDTGADRELSEVRNLLEKFRRQIFEESNRNAFFDQGQGFYDAAIDFEIAHRDDKRNAFQLSEESRARSLLDARQGVIQIVKNGSEAELRLQSLYRPLGLESIQRRMPNGIQLVQYAVLPDKVIAWIIERDKFTQVVGKMPAEELNRKISDLVSLLSMPSAPENRITSLLQELYRVLITPAEPYLNTQHSICFVPDGILHQLPFAALVSERNHYLIEDYAFVLSPSATAFILCSETAATKETRTDEQLLCLGNSQFDRGQAAGLSDLEDAATEAKEVAALYQRPMLLVDMAANESAFNRLAPLADVVHIASHALANYRSPLSSTLILSPDPAATVPSEAADGLLYMYELYRLNLKRVRLVVLSACKTGVGPYFKGEGIVSLARPFLVSGVPMVIASLWDVDSNATKKLMIGFHNRRVRENRRVVDALRQAQLDSLREKRQNNTQGMNWASFSVYGGYFPN